MNIEVTVWVLKECEKVQLIIAVRVNYILEVTLLLVYKGYKIWLKTYEEDLVLS